MNAPSSSQQHQWTYRPWSNPEAGQVPLRADNIISFTPGTNRFTIEGAVRYAEQAYLSCRLLMLASRHLHLEALYCAGQTLEKFMKALRKQVAEDAKRDYDPSGDGHCLTGIAKKLADTYSQFRDPGFLEVCSRLDPFSAAGRYPDNKVQDWEFYLNLLTFLDAFVVHCRGLLRLTPGQYSLTSPLLELLDEKINVIEVAAARAVLERNHELSALTGKPPAKLCRLRRRADQLQWPSESEGPKPIRRPSEGSSSTG